ncbi:putative beta-lactamase YbxI [Peribacillus sp. Bi96]|uniref:class D beta-lactamase n=1 Tax=unclassified Peribacillus TaxID=2675266 RepID=UPI001DD0F118|nr:class D beta-lactamase [Peribacillus sp. Bi96]CAH0262168.1 putative beta-lactamase YbxI [Peribacillus sp. Bi96]
MKKRKVLMLIGALVLITCMQQPIGADATKDKLNIKELDVDEFFSEHEGTFILREMKKDKTFIYNKERAAQRFAPQSTFKVPNALIGLQVGAVEDEYDIKYWDGVKREIEIWNQDHTLGSGLRNSVVWYYQAMARDIGEDRMEEWVQKISYGNQDISGGIDQFWLSSSLKISPIEQADFMESLYKENLPFDKVTMKTVKRMMIQTEGDNFTLYGKTGQGSNLGWYVGFIETNDHDYVFVTNISGTSADAKSITMAILKKYHLMAQ